jgi:hypothetical protein
MFAKLLAQQLHLLLWTVTFLLMMLLVLFTNGTELPGLLFPRTLLSTLELLTPAHLLSLTALLFTLLPEMNALTLLLTLLPSVKWEIKF